MNMFVSTAIAGTAAPALAANPDPIYAAIEAHKTAFAQLQAALETHTILEEELPRERRMSDVSVWEEKIVETDDPRWIECEKSVMRAWDAEESSSIALVSIKPTTRAGFLALIEHAVAHDTDGEGWPRELQSDDGERVRAWHYFLLENLVSAKEALLAA